MRIVLSLLLVTLIALNLIFGTWAVSQGRGAIFTDFAADLTRAVATLREGGAQ